MMIEHRWAATTTKDEMTKDETTKDESAWLSFHWQYVRDHQPRLASLDSVMSLKNFQRK